MATTVLEITVKDGDQYYKVVVTKHWFDRHDNGAMLSCGLTVGKDNFTAKDWARAKATFIHTELTQEQWNHSSCQSSCVLRGGSTCRW